MKKLYSRAVLCCLIILLGLLSALPSVLPDSVLQKMPSWYAQNQVNLGLDLRGGSHLLLEVDTRDLLREKNQKLARQIAKELRDARIFHAPPIVTGNTIELQLKDASQIDKVRDIIRPLIKPDGGGARLYNVEGDGGTLVLEASEQLAADLKRDALERSLEVVRRRLNETGMVDPTVTRQGEDSVLVQLPGVDDPQQIRQLLGTTARMSFHWEASGPTAPGGVITLPGLLPGERYQLEAQVALEGAHISDARLAFDQHTNAPVVTFKLDDEGARRFGEMTQNNIGRPLAIVLDEQVITAPVIRTAIMGGSGEISGDYTSAEASELALLLRAGALPAPLNVIEERTVGPDLGSDAIAMGLTTGLLGAALVFAFMVAIYGRWGVIACVGLGLNVGLMFGILSLLGATLTLPGIAGLILSIGMAVDANILINERIREETRRGQSAFAALNAGFKRAYSTIVDSNVTSLIAICLLFLFGSGPVRGFAVTMAIGLTVSMFTAITVTRLLMEWRVRKSPREPLVISGIKALDQRSNRTINFMRGRFVGLAASAVLSVAAVFLFFKPGLHYGIDFSGGSLVEVQAPTLTVEELRAGLQQDDLAQVAIQELAGSNQELSGGGNYLVRLPTQSSEQVASGAQVEEVKASILSIAPDAKFPRVETVGPKVSGNFADATMLAILLAGGGMLGYLWLRFESHFAIAATLTLALDLTKTIGFFVLAGIEFNLTAVAALLALIGYSVNDKVVVFDRIRESLRATPDAPLTQVLNESITSTLTRTVFTSVTTFLALLPMAIAGGAAVSSFALPMLFGIVIGTSSSTFIAAPIVLLLGERRMRKGLTQLRPTAEDMQARLAELP